jgi:very-short-patch-repair endonuclease
MSRDALERARRLRKGETEAERAAWNLLRNRQRLGHKFRRQQPLEKHIADFCCLELRLIIELDGSVHAQPSRRHRDETRDRELQAQGFKVLHISNGLVLNNPEGFIEKVEAEIASLDPSPPSPPPRGGRGEGLPEGVGRSRNSRSK